MGCKRNREWIFGTILNIKTVGGGSDKLYILLERNYEPVDNTLYYICDINYMIMFVDSTDPYFQEI